MKTISDRKTLSLHLPLWLSENLGCKVPHVSFGNCERTSRKMLILSHYLKAVWKKGQERQESSSWLQNTAALKQRNFIWQQTAPPSEEEQTFHKKVQGPFQGDVYLGSSRLLSSASRKKITGTIWAVWEVLHNMHWLKKDVCAFNSNLIVWEKK